jgi:hypothetical protein
MKHRKLLRHLLRLFCGVVAAYLLIYTILSLNGNYQVVLSDLRHVEYGWVPCGFYSQKQNHPTWLNVMLFRMYLPLFQFDEKYVHKNPPPPVWFPDVKK